MKVVRCEKKDKDQKSGDRSNNLRPGISSDLETTDVYMEKTPSGNKKPLRTNWRPVL